MIPFLISVSIVAIILLLASCRRKIDSGIYNNLNPYSGYSPHPTSYTSNASVYKTDWQYELDKKIDAQTKELMKKEGVDMVDEGMMKQAILDVIHLELANLSQRR